MKTVMAFGTFDLLHEGHEHFLKEAKKLGDKLYVVIAQDKTVEEVKHRKPVYTADDRRQNILDLKIADEVIIGHKQDKLKIIEQIKPDIIGLGYDQRVFTESLREELSKRGLDPEIVRLKSHKPHIHKSTKIRKKLGL